MAAITPGGSGNRVPGVGISGNHSQTGKVEAGAAEQREVVSSGGQQDPALTAMGALRGARAGAEAGAVSHETAHTAPDAGQAAGPSHTAPLAELTAPKAVDAPFTGYGSPTGYLTLGTIADFVAKD